MTENLDRHSLSDSSRRQQRRAWLTLVVIGLGAFLVGIAIHAAHAESGYVTCSGAPGSVVCLWGDGVPQGLGAVIHVPPPDTPELKAAAAERERRWVARCKPEIIPDKYGVDRYHYAEAGCEFGR